METAILVESDMSGIDPAEAQPAPVFQTGRIEPRNTPPKAKGIAHVV
jgi:hypothetical protein